MISEKFLEGLVVYTGFLLEVVEKQPSAKAMGKICNEIASHFRALGISWILLYSDINAFGQGLTQSALTRKYFLKRCFDEEHLDLPARKSSFIDPFLDAIAVNQRPLAKEIADLSPEEWWVDYEYEDDYAYAKFLYKIIDVEGADIAVLERIIEQFERAVEGNPSVRLSLCKALFFKDQDGFENAFHDLVSEFEDRNNEIGHPDSDSTLAQNYTFEPNRWIFVEGLALLRIAAWLGLPTLEEFKFCPNILRIDNFGPFDSGSFPYIKL